MKNPARHNVASLEDLPNICPVMARALRLLDIQAPQQLKGNDAYQMHSDLCKITGQQQDPCVIEVFLAAIDFMEGGKAAPWWDFTEERKKYLPREI